jgi:hypothetical protein
MRRFASVVFRGLNHLSAPESAECCRECFHCRINARYEGSDTAIIPEWFTVSHLRKRLVIRPSCDDPATPKVTACLGHEASFRVGKDVHVVAHSDLDDNCDPQN